MLYITTTQSLQNMPSYKEDNKLVLLCKENAAISLKDLEKILPYGSQTEIYYYEGKEDMLICLGAIVSSCEICTILDPALPVPQRFNSKVSVYGAPSKRGRKPGSKKKAQLEDTPKMEDEHVDQSIEDIIPRPVFETDTDVNVKEEENA